MADEIIALHSKLSLHYDARQNESLSLRLQGLGRAEAKILVDRCLGSQTSEALHLLSLCHLYGVGVPQNSTKAVEVCRESVSRDTPTPLAMNDLGDYVFPDGILPMDAEMTVYWYTRSANLGNSHGMRGLGQCLQRGMGIAKDEVKAVEWFQKAATLGDHHAMGFLALCHEHGKGVPKDVDKAIDLFARSGSPNSCWNLGLLLRATSPTTALQYFSRAHDLYLPGRDRMDCRTMILSLMTEDLRLEVLRRWRDDLSEVETLRTRVHDLETQVADLGTELRYRPGGDGYLDALHDFESLAGKN